MLLKFLLMARDKPFLFFLIAIPFLLLLISLNLFIVLLIDYYIFTPNNVRNDTKLIVSGLCFLPTAPFFFIIGRIFIEYYFVVVVRVLRVMCPPVYRFMIWLSGHPRREFVNSLVAWTGKSRADENKVNDSGAK